MKRYLDYMDHITVPDALHGTLTQLKTPDERKTAWKKYAAVAAALALAVGVGAYGLSHLPGDTSSTLGETAEWDTEPDIAVLESAGPADQTPTLGETAEWDTEPDIAVLESAGPADQTPTLGGYEVQEGEMTAYYMLPYIEYGTVEEAGLDLAPPAEVTTQELTQEEVLTLLGGEEAVKVHLGWEDYSLGGHAMVYPDGRLWMLVLGGWKEGADRVSINLTPDQLPPTCLFYMDSVVNHIGDLEVTAERYVGEGSQTLRVSFLTGGYGYRFIAMGTDGQASELLVSRFVRFARDGGLNLDALEGVLAAAAGRG